MPAYAEYEQHCSNLESAFLALRDQLRKQYSRCFAIFRRGADIKREITAAAKEIKADLIVVSPRNTCNSRKWRLPRMARR